MAEEIKYRLVMTREQTTGRDVMASIDVTPEQWSRFIMEIAHDNQEREEDAQTLNFNV